MPHKILLLSLTLILFASCTQTHYSWQQTEEGSYLFIEESEQDVSYSWQGETFDKVAHGNGKLTKSKGSTVISTENKNAFYGSFDDKGVTNLNNGGKYIGNLVEDKMTGFGVLFQGADLYIGDFKDGKPDGILNQYKNNHIYYSGAWQNGLFNGDGILYKEDGKKSEGIWRDNKLTYTFVDIDLLQGHYTGYIKDGKPINEGTMLYSDSCMYYGEWNNGMWNGYGTLRTKEFLYDGDFVNNKPNGIGYVTFNDSSSYNGGWLAGKRFGTGDMILPTGDLYSGGWSNDLFEGYGLYSFANGDIYEGEWKEGLQDGNGKYTSKDFNYDGHWEEGWINGEGVMEYANGDVYQGYFVENERYGYGTYIFADGNAYEGEFVDNKFQGLGVFEFTDGCSYEGEFWDGKVKGDGTLYLVLEKDTIAVTANWDGTDKFPKEASILLPNGLLYEGEIIDGKPTRNGIWTSTEESWIKSALDDANDFYKLHKEQWDEFVIKTSRVLATITLFSGKVAKYVSRIPKIGKIAGAAVLGIGMVAEIGNIALNVIDATVSISSAAIDGDWEGVANEVAINAAFILVPKALKSKPARKLASTLSKSAKNVAKKTLITLNKSKAFKKVVKVIKNGKGELEKTLANAKKRIRASRIGKKIISAQMKRDRKLLEKYAQKHKFGKEKREKLLREMEQNEDLAKLIREDPEFNIKRWNNTRNHVDKSKLARTSNGDYAKNYAYAGNTFYFNPALNPNIKSYLNKNGKFRGYTEKELKELDKMFPNGVPFNNKGFPDFAKAGACATGKNGKMINIKFPNGFTGNRAKDYKIAEDALRKSGYSEKEINELMKSNTWHHLEGNPPSMTLVNTHIHEVVAHSGGVSMMK